MRQIISVLCSKVVRTAVFVVPLQLILLFVHAINLKEHAVVTSTCVKG